MTISTEKSECLLLNANNSNLDNLLPYRRTRSTRMLGVRLDDKMRFSSQVEKLELWTRTRARVLWKMSKLGLHEAMKFRILASLKNSLLFGFWWLLFVSKTNFDRVEGFWNKLVKSIFEVNRPVPPDKLMDTLGLHSLGDTLAYLAGKTILENRQDSAKPKLLDDVFDSIKQQRSNNNSGKDHRTTAMSRRSTTAAKTNKSLQDAHAKQLGYPDRLIRIAELCNVCVKEHEPQWKTFANKEEKKRFVKKLFLRTKERPDYGTIRGLIDELNEKYQY